MTSPESAPLKACGHCGGEARLGSHYRIFENVDQPVRLAEMYWVECTSCLLRTDEYETPELVGAAWNRRVSPASVAPEFGESR